jgi:hypothetical protein
MRLQNGYCTTQDEYLSSVVPYIKKVSNSVVVEPKLKLFNSFHPFTVHFPRVVIESKILIFNNDLREFA